MGLDKLPLGAGRICQTYCRSGWDWLNLLWEWVRLVKFPGGAQVGLVKFTVGVVGIGYTY